MIRRLRAVWRLARMFGHLLHGLALMATRFTQANAPTRHGYVRWWSGKLLRLLGVRLNVDGRASEGACLVVANHVSWLDVACLHAMCPQARFVSKSDVLRWPLLGWLIRNAGSIFIERERKRDALRVVHQIASALGEGETVAIFPEGTTGEGPRLEPFHANLLQAAVTAEAPVQPVVLRYHRPGEVFSRAAPYVGDQTLLGSMWRIACADQLEVELSFLPVQTPALGQSRREWSQTLKMTMQSCLDAAAQN